MFFRYRVNYRQNFGSNNIKFQGQHCQDLFAYLYFGRRKNGFFMDIGANDGLTYSNTLCFEKLGWQGICIEPQSDVFVLLQKYRKCDCYNVALSSKQNPNAAFVKDGVLSVLKEDLTDAHGKRMATSSIEYVKTLTFDDIMANYPNRTYIDFLSLDVEGSEFVVLNTIDFSKYKFGLLTIENNGELEDERNKGKNLIDFMNRKGYKKISELGVDILFVPIDD
jgi:FkbM family methyltransferase